MPTLTNVYRLDKIVMPSSVEITELSKMSWDAGIDRILEMPAGHPHPMFTATLQQRSKVQFSTPQLSTVLGAIGVGGAVLGSTATYYKHTTQSGPVARATTTHKKITIASSFGYWSSLRLPHNQKAEVDVTLCACWDGTNDPFVYAGSQALSGNLTAAEYYTLGPCSLNGSEIPGVQEISIDSGVQLLEEGTAGEVWDRLVGLKSTRPVVTIKCKSEVNWSQIAYAGTALNGSTGLVFYARKIKANESRVANATAEHIKFIGLLGAAFPESGSGEGSDLISDTFKAELVSSSDSVLPLTGTTASAIT